MSSTATERGWGDPGQPGTASATMYRKAHIVTIDVGGIRLSVRREVAPLFAGFIMQIVKGGYDLTRVADDWGYASRYIRGYEAQKILSNHAWGLAIDLNAQDHPLGQRNTGVPRFVVEAAYDHGLFWGGDYKNRPDEMHFEFTGTPQDAANLIASMHPPTHPEDDVFEYRIVTIPPTGNGIQLAGKDVTGKTLGVFRQDVVATIKANDNGAPVKATVQVCKAFNSDDLVLSFIGLDGKPAPEGNVGIVLSHPPR